MNIYRDTIRLSCDEKGSCFEGNHHHSDLKSSELFSFDSTRGQHRSTWVSARAGCPAAGRRADGRTGALI